MSRAEPSHKSLDIRVLGIIAAFAIANHFGTLYFRSDGFSLADVWYLLGILACVVSAFFVSARYRGSEVFGRAYLFLGIGFVSWFIGEVLYLYYRYTLEIDPWPSPSDVFFIGSYVFASLHLIINSRYFKRKWSPLMKIWLIICPIAITSIYLFVAAQERGQYDALPFDLAYGGIFVLGVSVVFALAIIGVSVFRHSVLGTVWLLLAGGIFLWTIADIWYVYTEIFYEEGEQLATEHPINSIWIAAFVAITYSLIKHRKTL